MRICTHILPKKNAPPETPYLFVSKGGRMSAATCTSTKKQPPPAGHSRIIHRKVQQQHSKCVFRGFQHLAKFGGGSPWFYWNKNFRPNLISEDSHFFYQLHVLDGSSKLRCQNPQWAKGAPNAACICPLWAMQIQHASGPSPRKLTAGHQWNNQKKICFLGRSVKTNNLWSDCFPPCCYMHLHATCSQWMRE